MQTSIKIDPSKIRINNLSNEKNTEDNGPALSSAIITVVRDPNNVLGKQISKNPDGTVSKISTVNLSTGIAVMQVVNTHDELAALLQEVGEDPHAAIINAGFDGINIGEEFLILSERQIKKHTGIAINRRERQKGVHEVEYRGKPYKAVGRFKENVYPSHWQYLDRDIDKHTPEPYASMSYQEWLALMAKIFPGLADISYCHAASTSSRVLLDGVAVGAGNGHTWVKVEDPADIERFRTASLIQAVSEEMNWKKPRLSRNEPGKIVGHSLTTIFDPSVFTPGRLIFIGKPVAGEGLTVEPLTVSVKSGKSEFFDTAQVVLPEKNKIRDITRGAGVEMSVTSKGNGLSTYINDLSLDTELETQHLGIMTVRELIKKGDSDKIRCQTPFRDSNSFAAFFAFSTNGTPFVHDVGTGITHWLSEHDKGELRLIRTHAVVTDMLTKAKKDCGAPLEASAVEALAHVKSVKPADYTRIRAKLKRTKDVSVMAVDEAVDSLLADANTPAETHHTYAKNVIQQLTVNEHQPIGYAGSLYVYSPEEGIWEDRPVDLLIRDVAENFDGLANCKRGNDYKAIAEHAISLANDNDFFEATPVGLACPDGFYRIDGDEITTEPLTAEHRQRAKIDFAPVEQDTPLFDGFMRETFQTADDGETQQQLGLLQEITGAVMLGIMHRYHKAVLFYDAFGRAGKGTVERIVRQLVPADFVTAVSPFVWSKEYYVASLAGTRLNVVGELPDHEALPAAAFKTVIGGDLLTGRHPNHRPITFKNEAAHLFMSNHLINTRDHSEAYYSRWLLLEFPNSRLRSGLPIDPDLADRIIEHELPGIAYWALIGAVRLVQKNKFSSSIAHDRLMAKWRMTANSLEEYIHERCELGDDNFRLRRSEFYKIYATWCKDSGRRPFAKGRVKELLEHNIKLGISHARIDGNELFLGIKHKEPKPDSMDARLGLTCSTPSTVPVDGADF